jgi:cytochrome c oxidase cbb3-type subunit 3
MRPAKIIGIVAAVLAASNSYAQPGRGAPGQSPASQRPAATSAPQTYPPEQIQAGQALFASQCGFCHGRDAQGGESGPDLTRSALVAEDMRGDKIGPLVHSGRPEKGMPSFPLSETDTAAVVAFIHDAKFQAETAAGGRRAVNVDDLQTGNVDAGKRYFNGAGGCAQCHSLSGDFAKVGARLQGLALVQRMLYPPSGRGAPLAPPTYTVTTKTGEKVSGKLAYRDEFTITLIDPTGWSRSWPVSTVKISGENPLGAHIAQLAKYTDTDIHDLIAYLETLR